MYMNVQQRRQYRVCHCRRRSDKEEQRNVKDQRKGVSYVSYCLPVILFISSYFTPCRLLMY